MARNGGDVLGKKNSKLEAFLKRNLDVDTYERIRAHEHCIVCSEKEDKAFKFVLLSDEWIYLTENPPKKIYESVHLRDVISVDLVNEYPEFLNGEQRENTLHIVIQYWTDQPAKGKRKRSLPTPAPTTPRSARSQTTPRSARSLTGTSRSEGSGGGGGGGSSRLASKRLSLARLTPRESYETHTQSDTGLAATRLPLSNARCSDSAQKQGERTRGTRSGNVVEQDENAPPAVSLAAANLATTLLNRYSSERYAGVSQLARRLPSPADAWDSDGQLLDQRRRQPLKLGYGGTGELRLQLEKLDDGGGDDDDDDDDGGWTRAAVPHIRVDDISDNSSTHLNGEAAGRDEDGDQPQLRSAVLHLYVLNYSSPLLMLIRNAWNSCLIRVTLEEDAGYLHTVCRYAPRPAKLVSEKFEQLFDQLRLELLNRDNSLEDVFRLTCELRSAAERNFAIKRFFWKTADLFEFFIKQLQRYLPVSAVLTPGGSGEDEKLERADELELVLLLVETLQVMLRETDTLPLRLRTLQAAGGKTTLDLIVVLTCDPQVVGPAYHTTASTRWIDSADVELSKLQQEFNNSATAVLYELILIAHQANWGDKDGSFFNIAWLVRILEELNTTERFTERLIVESMRLISPSRCDELKPRQVVLVHQQFHLLQTLLTYSGQLADYIRNNFYEEFKYYIQAPVILQKLPKRYLLRPHVIGLIEQVMTIILKKPVTLLPPAVYTDNQL